MKKINALLKNDTFAFTLVVVFCMLAICLGCILQTIFADVTITIHHVALLFFPAFMVVEFSYLLIITAKEVLKDLK